MATFNGTPGNDTCGNDKMEGGAGSDVVDAGKGDDATNYVLAEKRRTIDQYKGAGI